VQVGRRTRAVAVLTALTVGLASTSVAAAEGDPVDPVAALADARSDLEGAARSLDDVQAVVRRASDEVAAADARLQAASTELDRLRGELAAAQVAAAAAVDAERAAAGRLADVEETLHDLGGQRSTHRERLQQRAVQAYKQGSVLPHDLLVRGISGASDWHEVTVTLETVGRLVHDDRTLVDDVAALTRTEATVRADAGHARREAIETARAAAVEERRVADLTARQERVQADVEAEHTRRQAALATLEQDAAARAALVAQLEEHVAELEVAALRALLPPLPTPVDGTALQALDLDLDGPPPPWAAGLPGDGPAWAAAIDATAARYGLDGRLLAALVWTESNFSPAVVSHAGAIGLAQLMPGTARGLGVDPWDPLQNLDGGARYLRQQLDTFGQIDLALAAYNAGPGRVHAAGPGVPDIVETQLYVVRVLERYRALARV
jgi:soluble lytic murein transglycosylase-like protein